MARLKLATFNVNGIRARHDALLDWLKREQPDIACLQELKAPDEAFPAADLEKIGYGAIWHGQKSWNGVAILARGTTPVERRRGLPDDPDPTQSRYLEAEVHGLVVGCLYLPNGNPWPGPKFEYKLRWFDELNRHAKSMLADGAPTVLAGDFNVVPTDALDIYDAKSWRKDALLQPESRDAYVRLIAQGWTDSLRTVLGDEKIFTFWDYFRKHWERNAGLRIDHLLLSPGLAPTLKNANVDRWVRGETGASDHAPTWVELQIGTPEISTTGVEKRPGKVVTPDIKGVAPKRSRASSTLKHSTSDNAVRGREPVPTASKSKPTGKPAAKRALAGAAAAAKARSSDVGDATPRASARKSRRSTKEDS